MAAPTSITELSQTAGSNGPDGSSTYPRELDNYQRAHAAFIAQLRDGKGHAATASVASATTTDIGAANSLAVEITGTTTITGFGTAYSGPRFIRFAGALTLTHSAALSLPGAANITTAAGDTCVAVPNLSANGWTVLAYQRYAGLPAKSGANSDLTTISTLTGFGNTSASHVTIGTDGSVGVGTANRVGVLTVKTATDTKLSVNDDSGTLRFQSVNDAYDNLKPMSFDATNIAFQISSVTMAQVNGNGLGVGIAAASGARFHVQGAGSTDATKAVRVANSSAADLFFVSDAGAFNTGTGSSSPYNATTAAAANLVVDSGGYFYRSTSSIRYKKNVQDYRDGLAKVMALRPVTYQSKAKGDVVARAEKIKNKKPEDPAIAEPIYAGLIAEEVHAAGLGEFVQYNEDGEPDAVNYANMVALAFKAIQDQQAQIAALTSEVAKIQRAP